MMKCAWLALLAGASLCAPAPAVAQTPQAPGPSRFDAAIYGGASWTSDWLAIRDTGFPVGWNPIVGGFATLWTQPRFGVRLHGGYIPSRLPRPDNLTLSSIPDGRVLNIWLYDLDLMFRPFAGRASAGEWLSSAYLFAGAGGLTANVAGDSSQVPFSVAGPFDRTCVFPYAINNACLSYSPSRATVGQGTVGLGFTVLPLTRSLGLFAEAAVHVYDSPFHVGPVAAPDDECLIECQARDMLAFTPRLVGGLRLAAGRPRPAPAVMVPPPPPPLPLPAEERIRVCILVNDLPQYVDATVRPETGDTLVNVAGQQRPFGAVYPADRSRLAAGAPFAVGGEPITVMGRRYLPFGVPRLLGPGDIVRVGEYRGYSLFAEPNAATPPPVVYLPVRPNCEYQPYQLEQEVLRVRG